MSGVKLLHAGYRPSILAMDEGWRVGVKGLDEGFVKTYLWWQGVRQGGPWGFDTAWCEFVKGHWSR